MTSQSVVSPARSRPSPVLVLGIGGVLTFALIPIKINTIYSGLPAHPLFLHVPVILIPVAGLAALALAARPSWWVRHGVRVTFLAVVALGALNLTMGAGKALCQDLTAAATIALRAALAVLAALCLYFVFHTGDLGAKAAWQGRIHSGGGFGGGPSGGGGVGSLFGGGVSGPRRRYGGPRRRLADRSGGQRSPRR